LYSSPYVIRVIKSRRKRLAMPVKYMEGGGEVHAGLWFGNLNDKQHLEELGVDERMVI